ncbi:MAG TPA: hypothetical protein VGS19_29130 [Streptosporangiaceae bacterium]|nr:hypothetical protein [Streptosporangiaceae bacterium]
MSGHGSVLAGGLIVAVCAVAAVVFAVKWLRTHQLGPCRKCKGSRRNWLSTEKRWGPCRGCGGTGQRRRRF